MLKTAFYVLQRALFNRQTNIGFVLLAALLFSKNVLAVYGISIDDTVFSQDKRCSYAVRMSLFDIDKQGLKEALFYTLSQNSRENYAGSLVLPNREKTVENPIRSIHFNNGAADYIVVNEDFDSQNYLIISKFPVYKFIKETGRLIIIDSLNFSHEFNSGWFGGEKNLFRVYAQQFSSSLQSTPEGMLDPIYRVISVDGYIGNRITTTMEELGMDHPGFQKGDLGELSMDLWMTRWGYVKYPSKYGEEGFDGVYASPDGSIVYLTDSKWFKKPCNLKKIINQSLRDDQIESRKNQMRTRLKEYPEFSSTLALLGNLNARIYKGAYLITSNGTKGEWLQEEVIPSPTTPLALGVPKQKNKDQSQVKIVGHASVAMGKIELLLKTFKTQTKVASLLAPYCTAYKLSQPRLSEFLRGAPSANLNSAIEAALREFEKANGEIGG